MLTMPLAINTRKMKNTDDTQTDCNDDRSSNKNIT
jgi:hypothetical protein